MIDIEISDKYFNPKIFSIYLAQKLKTSLDT